MKPAWSVSGLLGGGDVPLGACVNTLFRLCPRGADVGESCVCPTPPSPHPTLLGQVMGGATWGALLGSVAAAVDHVSEIALFWMCLLDDCLYL